MISHGHSWSSIKDYSLSEIGAFLNTVVLLEKEKKAEQITNIWIGTHVDQEGLQEIIRDIGITHTTNKGSSQDKVNKDWRRLAMFMAKHQ